MNIYLKIFLLLLVFMFSNVTSRAQMNLMVGPAIGFTIPAADYGGNAPAFYKTGQYGLSPGFHFGAESRLGLGKIAVRLASSYAMLSANGLSDEEHNDSFVAVNQRLLNVSLGVQYGFVSIKSVFGPYAGVDLLYSSITSSADFLNTATLTNPTQTITMNAATRFGLGLALGADFRINKTTLDLSLRYNMINMFGKKYEAPATGTRDDVYRYLNDAADPNYNAADPNHPVAANRNIATVQVQIGVLFGFKL